MGWWYIEETIFDQKALIYGDKSSIFSFNQIVDFFGKITAGRWRWAPNSQLPPPARCHFCGTSHHRPTHCHFCGPWHVAAFQFHGKVWTQTSRLKGEDCDTPRQLIFLLFYWHMFIHIILKLLYINKFLIYIYIL